MELGMADLDGADAQDHSEVFDEDNTNPMERGPGEEAEQFEDLLDLLDVTSAVGDSDDDEAVIAEELDDEAIVASAETERDDDEATRADQELDGDEDSSGAALLGEDDSGREEVELEFLGDLNDRADARSAAQDLESEAYSELDDEEDFDPETGREQGDAPA